MTEKSNIAFRLHQLTGCPISECEKAYDIAMEYLRIRNFAIGDYPEKVEKPELVLVQKRPEFLGYIMAQPWKKKTNRERLREMSDEELGKLFCHETSCGFCSVRLYCCDGHNGYTYWLKQGIEDTNEP